VGGDERDGELITLTPALSPQGRGSFRLVTGTPLFDMEIFAWKRTP